MCKHILMLGVCVNLYSYKYIHTCVQYAACMFVNRHLNIYTCKTNMYYCNLLYIYIYIIL